MTGWARATPPARAQPQPRTQEQPMDTADQQFYNQRANDVQNATNSGDIEAAAALVAHTLIEEGPAGLTKLTDAITRGKN